MKKVGKLNKLKVSIVVILIVLAFSISVFGRYIYNAIREAYFVAEEFYFTSDILTVNGSNYQYNNWGGTEVYPIQFYLYSYESQVAKLDYNLNYTVTCSTSNSDKVKCSINSYGDGAPTTVNGTIPSSTNSSEVTVYVTPLTTINEGETVSIEVTASTSVPYQKTISCTFTLERETPQGVSYTIEDAKDSEYAILKLTNINDAEIPITLSFDADELRIDSNDEIYINRKTTTGSTVTTTIGGKQYVEKIVFNLAAETTRYVKFYKVDKTQNYTYTGVAGTNAITVTI